MRKREAMGILADMDREYVPSSDEHGVAPRVEVLFALPGKEGFATRGEGSRP
jgi:hypothetical protein